MQVFIIHFPGIYLNLTTTGLVTAIQNCRAEVGRASLPVQARGKVWMQIFSTGSTNNAQEELFNEKYLCIWNNFNALNSHFTGL
jgi:uncharacterized protein with NRDE domain